VSISAPRTLNQCSYLGEKKFGSGIVLLPVGHKLLYSSRLLKICNLYGPHKRGDVCVFMKDDGLLLISLLYLWEFSRLSTIRNVDTIAFINDGQVQEKGSHQSLMSKPESAYAQFVSIHQQK